ncbi:hypothetical protein BGZ73_002552 [Actinomortierella ambigua]|nr:hypothetical protein BGZ73_002552 [Actinomortierella ambigua]
MPNLGFILLALLAFRAVSASMPNQGIMLLILIAFRAINALLVQTYFSPDEYWQALEVGHHIAFGYGYLTWEWRSDVGLRSVLHPSLFAALYKALAWAGLDNTRLLILGPRLLQAVFAALADLYTYKFAYRLFRSRAVAQWTLRFSVLSWWNFFCSTRTLANSLEASLTIVALYYWPFPQPTTTKPANDPSSLPLSLTLAFITCLFRPTAAIVWIFLGSALLLHHFRASNMAMLAKTIGWVAFLCPLAIGCSAYLDFHLLYHEWVLTPVNFVRFNILQGIAIFYGSSPWHWYLSQGIPILFTIYIPFVLHGAKKTLESSSSDRMSTFWTLKPSLTTQVLHLSLWTLIVYSSLSHKEWRFLYPIFYPLLPFAGYSAYTWTTSLIARAQQRSLLIVLLLLAVGGPMAWYTTMVHQRGVVDVMDWIRQETHAGRVTSLGVLMPCHSTPWASSIHHPSFLDNDKMWFITCEPPIKQGDEDESDKFYKDPVAYMDTHGIGQIESHLMIFEDLLNTFNTTKPWFDGHGYKETTWRCDRLL